MMFQTGTAAALMQRWVPKRLVQQVQLQHGTYACRSHGGLFFMKSEHFSRNAMLCAYLVTRRTSH
jgi:hypothetical protein